MAAYATKLAEGFASGVVRIFFEKSVSEEITNQDYEGEMRNTLSKLNILSLDSGELKDYNGSNLTADDLAESIGTLITDQQKAYYFKIKSLDRFKSWVKDPENTMIDRKAKLLKQAVDTYILGLWGDVAAGNRVGTDYATGTVTVDVTTGVVTGSGTTFTAAMVGKGFKAAGHTKWYRIKTYTSATSIVIEDDKDDEASAYTGGAIGAGAAYTVEAVTPITLTKANIYSYIVALAEKLDEAEIPDDDRWLVVPPKIKTLLVQAGELTPALDQAYREVIKKGYIGEVAGFMLFKNKRVAGDNTSGYHILAGHKSAITFALGFVESKIEEDLIGNFGKAYKGLSVYGAKVVDERRKALAELLGKV